MLVVRTLTLLCAFALAWGEEDEALSLLQKRAGIVAVRASVIRASVATRGKLEGAPSAGYAPLPAGARLGDMFVPHFDGEWANDLIAGDAAHVDASKDLAVYATAPACSSRVPSSDKILIIGLVPSFHGSTALQSVFMSSSEVSTLCLSGAWQCEAGALMWDLGEEKDKRAQKWVVDDVLQAMGEFWNRPVLFDKTPSAVHAVEKLHTSFATAKIPRSLYNVQTVRPVYVVMWRPTCLWRLSHHAQIKANREKSKRWLAYMELRYFKLQANNYDFLVKEGGSAIVLSLADLMWSPRSTLKRLEHFLPCLGKLDANYIPQLGRDIVEDNMWKANGSVVSFGQSVSPHNLGYNMRSGRCSKSANLFSLLPVKARKQAMKLEGYLLSLSSS